MIGVFKKSPTEKAAAIIKNDEAIQKRIRELGELAKTIRDLEARSPELASFVQSAPVERAKLGARHCPNSPSSSGSSTHTPAHSAPVNPRLSLAATRYAFNTPSNPGSSSNTPSDPGSDQSNLRNGSRK